METLASWIAALATVAAVIAAVVAGRYAKSTYELDRNRHLSDQATRISTWPSHETATNRWGTMIRNASDNAVYNVALTTTWEGSDGTRTDIAVLPPGLYFVPPKGQTNPDKRPRYTERVTDESAFSAILQSARIRLDISFRDASGRHWQREDQSALTPV